MPGMAAARAMALAAITESPIALTCLPVTSLGVADGGGARRDGTADLPG
jgi:hypothetical protein